MSKATYSSDDVCNGDVRRAFINCHLDKNERRKASGRAGRVVSGLLKAAAQRGDVEVVRTHGRVTASVGYVLSEEQLASIRAEAIKRAGSAS